ncbi:hypothetical protein IPH92_02255 [Candidatus Kaiserbacteria bacterium]|nr:MAG: hypothetical protein IPH92_02255 [Candidatus Kaiserbacteria bacterium]
MKTLLKILPFTALTPMLALAQGDMTELASFISNFVAFINGTLVPLIFVIAFLVFLWGMFKTFILGGSDEGKQSEGRQLMVYAIVAFVVMVSLWGIVNLLADAFGLEGQIINIPDTISI